MLATREQQAMPGALQGRSPNLMEELFQNYAGPAFAIRLWNGRRWTSQAGEKPAFTVVVATPGALATLLTNANEVALGEAFIHGEIDVEGDIFSVFSAAEYLVNRPQSLLQRTKDILLRTFVEADLRFHRGARHSRERDRACIAFHYDQPVEFFRPWLGSTLVYSCAYFRNAGDSLDRAQTEKLELICRKLRLQPGENFLDIGCGWGSLILHAAGTHHARAHGITLSRIQAETARQRIEDAGLGSKCTVELRDYRDCEHLRGSLDKIASVGMYEHVGLKNLPTYFHTVHRFLRPGGTFLNHGIARSPSSPVREDSFIDRYVFPDGRLVTLSQAICAAEAAGFEVRDAENLREHYDLTLRKWVEALRANQEKLRSCVSETTLRTWLLYMAGSAAAFRRGDIAVYQLLLSRTEQGRCGLPLVREDWYANGNRERWIQA